jgi:hypothetical protein
LKVFRDLFSKTKPKEKSQNNFAHLVFKTKPRAKKFQNLTEDLTLRRIIAELIGILRGCKL